MTAAVGQPIARVDGPAKVTGDAKYAAEFAPEGLVYAPLIESTIPAGSIKAIDSKAAEGAPGVLLVLTHRDAPKLPYLPAKERAAVEPVAGEALKSCRTRKSFSAGSRSASSSLERSHRPSTRPRWFGWSTSSSQTLFSVSTPGRRTPHLPRQKRKAAAPKADRATPTALSQRPRSR